MTPRTPGSRAHALRAGAIAVAVGLLVPGGAYAAVATTSASTQNPDQARAVKDDAGIASLGSSHEAASTSPISTEESLVVEDTTEAHGSTEEETDQLPKGEKKVKTTGVDGVARVTYRVISADGVEVSREAVSSVVMTAKVDEVVLVGTKDAAATPTASSGADSSSGSSRSAAAPADDGSLDDDFRRLAQCESGGNPRAVNPAGYYGLYQFSLETWASVGGTGNPIDASPEEQTMRAKILQRRSGWSQWGCGH
ncbi:resuscitation-promoting factor [Actinomyces marmotae]|uniref:Resuscitation-promoting factor n=1 Tax=Actinomyces marmotae TaxID=2737173 RepID=A0A6M8B088_9ACTO|nr:resuscitation-promoting factor [Actinomyces marmotae]QKD80329.1 resuscitation-promoting factor [Actinomyces marmotae]